MKSTNGCFKYNHQTINSLTRALPENIQYLQCRFTPNVSIFRE